jgi:hypothetical protein
MPELGLLNFLAEERQTQLWMPAEGALQGLAYLIPEQWSQSYQPVSSCGSMSRMAVFSGGADAGTATTVSGKFSCVLK